MDQRLHLPELLAYRELSARRRAVAMTRAPFRIAGVKVGQVTLLSWSRLHAIRSPFAIGGRVQFSDVADFLWLHSPHYRESGGAWARIVRAAVLLPLIRASGRFHRAIALQVLAEAEIRELIDLAFADAPPASRLRRAEVASLHASLAWILISEAGLSLHEVDALPLSLAFQFLRVRRSVAGGEVEDSGENQILAAYLTRKNESRIQAHADHQ